MEVKKLSPPEDCITIAQYAERYGVSRYAAMRKVSRLIEAGVLTLVGSYGPKGTNYYRLT